MVRLIAKYYNYHIKPKTLLYKRGRGPGAIVGRMPSGIRKGFARPYALNALNRIEFCRLIKQLATTRPELGL